MLTSLQLLSSRVKKARSLRQEMTPEVGAAYDNWQTTYRAAKHQVEAVLLLCGKTSMMSLVFDDLAEVHQVAGVSDGEAPAETAAPTAEVATRAPDPTEPTV